MPPKAGIGRGKRLAGKYRQKKRKVEETTDLQDLGDLEVQEANTHCPSRERRKITKKCPWTPAPSPSVSRSPQQSVRFPESSPQQTRMSPQQPPQQSQESESSDDEDESAPPPTLPAGKGRSKPQESESSDDEDESAPPPTLPAGKSKSKPQVGKGKGDKGKAKSQNETQTSSAPYSFTEEEEAIAGWVKRKRLLYDMKDKQYKDKALRRQLWEGKAAEYGVDYNVIQKWYHTQRTRFSKLREGQPKKNFQKRSGAGVSSGDEEDLIHGEEASENDTDCDKFIRRVFGFLKPHIRRHKKDTPASFKDKLALAETGELAASDDSLAGTDEPREATKKYTGYPTPRLPSRTRKTAEDRPESPTMDMRPTGASHDLQDKLVQFITREQQVNRATPFCKYLENELDRLHVACLEPAIEESTTVLNHYRKVSRQLRMREAAGENISNFEDVPSALPLQSQQTAQQMPGASYSRVSQHQQETTLTSGTYHCPTTPVSSRSSEWQQPPRHWPMNPPPATVYRSQECGYAEQATQQFNKEQQQQYHTLQPAVTTSTQGYIPSTHDDNNNNKAQ